MTEVTIIIVTWNSERFLPNLMSSLFAQSYRPFDLVVIDNGSKDQTCEFLKKKYPGVLLIRHSENLGFSRAFNEGIRIAKTPFVLISNHDIILDPNFLYHVMTAIKNHPDAAAIGGKILKGKPNLKKEERSDRIDTAGMLVFKSRRAVDRGENEVDHGQFNREEEVFGISGALALYRKSALEESAHESKEYFDEDFFAYKEDVDLAWRLKRLGFKAIYVPKAVAWHERGVERKTDLSDRGTIRNRRRKASWANRISWRNHLFILIKNNSLKNTLWNPSLLFYEGKKMIYLFLKEPQTLFAIKDLITKLPTMLQKRREIERKAQRSPRDLEHWFV